MKLSPTLITQLGSDDFYNYIEGEINPLPRIYLASLGRYVDEGKINPGSYGIPDGDDILELGPSIDILPLARRPKALDTMSEPHTVVYDHKSPKFKELVERSQVKDSGCMRGISFLVFVWSTMQFCEFYCGSKSSRERAYLLAPYLPLTPADIAARNLDAKPRGPSTVTLKSELVQGGWHVSIIEKCPKRFTKFPKWDDEITQFVNPIERAL